MNKIFLASFILLIFGCSDSDADQEENLSDNDDKSSVKLQTDQWTYKAIFVDDKGWGYQLFRGSHLEINQKNIPAVNGLHYFQSENKASLAAKFALEKVEQGFFPPTVNPQELDSIGAINLDSLNEETAKMLESPDFN